MAIELNGVFFDPQHTAVEEKLEEVGGRNARSVVIRGLIVGASAIAEIESVLDAILEAASVDDYNAPLSLRESRRLWVRREAFTREIDGARLVGSFNLKLAARVPFEESETLHSEPWTIAESGAEIVLSSAGNLFAQPVVTLVPADTLVRPALTDGSRTMVYDGTVAAGRTLVFDAPNGRVNLDGDDVTPYTEGEFPRIGPSETTLVSTGESPETHAASATVAFRDRWW